MRSQGWKFSNRQPSWLPISPNTPNLTQNLITLSIEASNQLVGKNMTRKCVSKRKGRDRSFTSNHPFFQVRNQFACLVSGTGLSWLPWTRNSHLFQRNAWLSIWVVRLPTKSHHPDFFICFRIRDPELNPHFHCYWEGWQPKLSIKVDDVLNPFSMEFPTIGLILPFPLSTGD